MKQHCGMSDSVGEMHVKSCELVQGSSTTLKKSGSDSNDACNFLNDRISMREEGGMCFEDCSAFAMATTAARPASYFGLASC